MRRREFVRLFGSATVAFRAVAAQGAEQPKRVGLLTNLAEDDPETRSRLDAFLAALRQLGWRDGSNLKIEYRWGVGDSDNHRKNAAELVALRPDVIVAHGSTIMGPLQRTTKTIPIVFVSVSDPVAGGFASSLGRPGGNSTGFTTFEYGQSAKWLEVLKEIVPDLKWVAVIRDPEQVSGGGQLGALQAAASFLKVELNPIGTRDMSEIDRSVAGFAERPKGGLIVTTAAWAQIHRDELVGLAARHRLPAMYPYRIFVRAGGLSCYTPDIIDQYRRAATYVDRILKGENPGEMAIQAPTKFELVLNLKTAKALGIAVPPSVLSRADEVVE